MTPKLLLRLAASLVFVHLLGHSVGHTMWDKPEDPRLMEIVSHMKGYRSEFMGATKSIGEYYHGYSLILIVMFASMAWILWTSSNLFRGNERTISRFLLPVAVSFIIYGVIEFLYFFPFAASMSFFAGVLILVAALKKSKAKSAGAPPSSFASGI
jgi:uncharacterized ion transporter superfamily protein YfcC